MADADDKVEMNVAGKYYVDSSCIDCDVCRETASDNFLANEDEGYSYVSKQPENDDEEALCEEAKRALPNDPVPCAELGIRQTLRWPCPLPS